MFQKTLSTLFLIIAPTIYSADYTTKPATTRAEYERARNAREAAERKDWRKRDARLANLFLGLGAQPGVAEHIAADPLSYALYPRDYIEDVNQNRRAADQTFLGRASQKMLEHVIDPARKPPVFQPLKEVHDRFLQLDADIVHHKRQAKDATLELAQRSEHHKLVARLEFARSEIVKKDRDTYHFFEDLTTKHFKSNTRLAAGFFILMAACETKMREQAKADRKHGADAIRTETVEIKKRADYSERRD
ncbi:MAG: hypothetical protein D4R39_02005 [Methylophilaceae bacterium]|nr:MAG: hypothetical protein D4R39_02005 [Methylophilaceae bacterium]